jgi:hypothetical protein
VPSKNVIPIAVLPSAKAAITTIAKKHGMKELTIATRVYEWFAAQEDIVQKGILRMLPEGYEADIAKMALERMAGKEPKAKRAG